MKEQRKYLTEEELKRFLKGIESTRDRPFSPFPTAAACGRPEPGQLKLSDWDRKVQRLFVHRGKGSVSGQALLSPAESRTLEAWIRVRGCPEPGQTGEEPGVKRAVVDRPGSPHFRHFLTWYSIGEPRPGSPIFAPAAVENLRANAP
jgi:integrase